MTLKQAKFGSEFNLSDKFIKAVLQSSVVENIVNMAKLKDMKALEKNLKGNKRQKLIGIHKLDDANNAGTKNSEKCLLILTEGDSAKTLAMSGLEVVGRDYYGVFPLKGKLLNVREASNSKIMDN